MSPTNARGQKLFYWNIVWNNYTNEDCKFVKEVFREIGDSYVIGKEVDTSETQYLQMMIKLKKGNYKSFLTNKLSNKFLIIKYGNIEEMRKYCTENDNIIEMKNIIEKDLENNILKKKLIKLDLENNILKKELEKVDLENNILKKTLENINLKHELAKY